MTFTYLNYNELRKTDFKEGRVYKSIMFNNSVGQGTYFVKTVNGKKIIFFKDIVGRVIQPFLCSLNKFIEVA